MTFKRKTAQKAKTRQKSKTASKCYKLRKITCGKTFKNTFKNCKCTNYWTFENQSNFFQVSVYSKQWNWRRSEKLDGSAQKLQRQKHKISEMSLGTALMLAKGKGKKWRWCQRQSSKFTTHDPWVGNGIPHHRFCDANPSRYCDEHPIVTAMNTKSLLRWTTLRRWSWR